MIYLASPAIEELGPRSTTPVPSLRAEHSVNLAGPAGAGGVCVAMGAGDTDGRRRGGRSVNSANQAAR